MSNAGEQEMPPSTTDAWDHLRWWAAAIASLAWLALYVYFDSSRGMTFLEFLATLGWSAASLGLAGFWIAVAAVAIRAWISRNMARAWRTTAFLVPFPMIVAIAIFLSANNLPLRVRFELSEGPLTRLADEYDRTLRGNSSGWSGLYHVERVHQWENCTVIVTRGTSLDENGFARCSGHQPDLPSNVTLEHLKGDWWTYDYYEDS